MTTAAPPTARTGEPHDPPGTGAAPMLTVLLNLLAPLLSAGGLTDPALARRAAADALTDYRVQGEAQLLTAAQVVGYGISGLDLLQIAASSPAPPVEQVRLRNAASRLAVMSSRAGRTLTTQQGEAIASASAAALEVDDAAQETAALAGLQATAGRLQEVRASLGQHAGDHCLAGPVSDEPHQADDRPGDHALSQPAAQPQETEAPRTPAPIHAAPVHPASVDAAPPTSEHVPALVAEPARHVAAAPTRPPTGNSAPLPDAKPAPKPARAAVPTPLTATSLPANPLGRRLMTPAEERAHKLMWAGAMTQVAQESAAHLPALPVSERRLERIRISALSSVARGLTEAAYLPPRVVPPSGPARPG